MTKKSKARKITYMYDARLDDDGFEKWCAIKRWRFERGDINVMPPLTKEEYQKDTRDCGLWQLHHDYKIYLDSKLKHCSYIV